jgi:hypothetical protein
MLGESVVSEVILTYLSDNGYVVERLTQQLLEIESPVGIKYQVRVTMVMPELSSDGHMVVTSSHAAIGDSVSAATEDMAKGEPVGGGLAREETDPWFGGHNHD